MFDQSHGLRFDIYERIHLPAELPGIAELEEVELIPDIQVIQREDRAELYGQLLLTGLYRGEDDRTQRLEHAIPVEITVPLTRVSSLEDIGVEIENFDIDLLTMRTVNITGVLSLRGIGSGDAQPAWQQEEYTVAYSADDEEKLQEAPADKRERENDALYENSLWTYGEGATDIPAHDQGSGHGNVAAVEAPALGSNPVFPEESGYTQPAAVSEPQQKDKEPKVRTHSLDAHSDNAGNAEVWESMASGPVAEIHSVDREEPSHLQEAVENAASLPAEAENEAKSVSEAESLPEKENNGAFAAPDVEPATEEKPDLKIGLGSKKEQKEEEREHLTFSSLLSSSRSRKEQEDQRAQELAPPAAASDAGNNTEWKSRFIGGRGSADLFRKVRLCIVQREETLDTIAEKYQLSARELVMYNRLTGQNVEEGQVLYIP
ncbi:LysM peptidoglycan-binding domain-containing protein [Paenibacillus sp. sgz5001063]|uniref:LysM peptidoglycan-binding domain-containing protein n=1 Tax=Paenibacillus sp. sgz5001063 TaxID=3242474 RepID=UPI0036D34FD3